MFKSYKTFYCRFSVARASSALKLPRRRAEGASLPLCISGALTYPGGDDKAYKKPEIMTNPITARLTINTLNSLCVHFKCSVYTILTLRLRMVGFLRVSDCDIVAGFQGNNCREDFLYEESLCGSSLQLVQSRFTARATSPKPRSHHLCAPTTRLTVRTTQHSKCTINF
jgi:hypothetical protein